MNQGPIKNLVDYAESLVQPLRVLVVDTELGSFEKVANALAPYDAEVFNASCGCEACNCLQKFAPFDLVFIGAPLKLFGTPSDIVDQIQRISPGASVVIMARNLDEEVGNLVDRGPFTFLKKNGNFDSDHIQRIAGHLNLKLRPSGKT